MIYIASPYSDISDAVRYDRFIRVQAYTHSLMARGISCFSPIAYGRQFEKAFAVPPTYEYWQDFNDYILLACTKMHVLKLEGWKKSRGVAHEIQLAETHGIETLFVEPR
jgi:hypothetical protein